MTRIPEEEDSTSTTNFPDFSLTHVVNLAASDVTTTVLGNFSRLYRHYYDLYTYMQALSILT